MRYRRIGVLFDLDGTVIKDKGIWKKILGNIMGDENVVAFREFVKANPAAGIKAYRDFMARELGVKEKDWDLNDRFRVICAKAIKDVYPEFIEGFVEFRQELKMQEATVAALMTNTPTCLLDLISEKLPLNRLFIRRIYNSSLVGNVFKPDPTLIRYTMRKINREAQFCVAIEDSPEGVQAAHAAGVRCIGLNSGGKLSEKDECELLVNSYKEITVDHLDHILNPKDLSRLKASELGKTNI